MRLFPELVLQKLGILSVLGTPGSRTFQVFGDSSPGIFGDSSSGILGILLIFRGFFSRFFLWILLLGFFGILLLVFRDSPPGILKILVLFFGDSSPIVLGIDLLFFCGFF